MTHPLDEDPYAYPKDYCGLYTWLYNQLTLEWRGGDCNHDSVCKLLEQCDIEEKKMHERKNMEEEIDNRCLMGKLADDVWAIAKDPEISEQKRKKLKTISSCLHDIRTGRETDWYEKL
ncbi:MAG: hypothetical protein J7L15_07480 [Clostridiales bacterium]|nr:hypothetical protein [Clostridiales bacterium]